jgi:hypothetical protein
VAQKGFVWTRAKEDIESVDWQGRYITLESVPVEFNQEKKITRVRLDDLIKAEQEYLANEHGLNPRHIHQLLLLYAAFPPFIKRGYIEQKFRFNKMLFYLWKRMEEEGYGDSYIYDKFARGRAGPIPKHLKDDMVKLQEKGIVEISAIKDGKKIATGKEAIEKCCKPDISIRCELTDLGKKVAKSIWDNTPDDIKKIALDVKKNLFFVDATQLKEKVHKDYPEYKKTYIELDTE